MSPISPIVAAPAGANASNAVGSRFERECVQFFSEVVQIFGIPKSVGQIYGVLYASQRPLGFSDIVAQLDISKGSASQGVQLLRELGAIREYRGGGQRGAQKTGGRPERRGSEPVVNALDANRSVRVLYEPELSLRRLVSGMLHERIAPMAATSAERLTKLKELAEQHTGSSGFYLGRAKQLNTWRRRLKAILPVLGALLGPTHEQR